MWKRRLVCVFSSLWNLVVKVNQRYGCTAGMPSEVAWYWFSGSYWQGWETHHQFELQFSAARNLRKVLLRTFMSLIFQTRRYFLNKCCQKHIEKNLWCLQLLGWNQASREWERFSALLSLGLQLYFNFCPRSIWKVVCFSPCWLNQDFYILLKAAVLCLLPPADTKNVYSTKAGKCLAGTWVGWFIVWTIYKLRLPFFLRKETLFVFNRFLLDGTDTLVL